MSEKRVFVKKLDDGGKESFKKKFIDYLKKHVDKSINPNEIMEVEDSNKYSLLWSDGVRMYSINRFNREVKRDGLYSQKEKDCIKKFFSRFTSVILGEKLNPNDILDEDTPDTYKIKYMKDGNEVFAMVYDKKEIPE